MLLRPKKPTEVSEAEKAVNGKVPAAGFLARSTPGQVPVLKTTAIGTTQTDVQLKSHGRCRALSIEMCPCAPESGRASVAKPIQRSQIQIS